MGGMGRERGDYHTVAGRMPCNIMGGLYDSKKKERLRVHRFRRRNSGSRRNPYGNHLDTRMGERRPVAHYRRVRRDRHCLRRPRSHSINKHFPPVPCGSWQARRMLLLIRAGFFLPYSNSHPRYTL